MKTQHTFLTFLVVLLIILTAFDVPYTNPNEGIAGKWSKQKGVVWEIKANNTYSITFGPVTINGKYTVTNNKVVLIDTSTEGVKKSCADGEKGTYIFTIKDSVLDIKEVQDPCSARRFSIPGVYKKL
jgi:hypothetical protein